MSEAYANKLESWFYGLPSLVQEVLQEPFDWMNDGLKAVAGDPEAMMAAVGEYQKIATSVGAVGTALAAERTSLHASWADDAYTAFSARVDELDRQLEQIVTNLGELPELLRNSADACVEGANMIIDIVTSLIMFALSAIAVNVALALVTLGTSLAAGVASVVARAAAATAKVLRVFERVAAVLERVAAAFAKIEGALRQVLTYLRQIMAYLKKLKAATKDLSGKERLLAEAKFRGTNTAVTKGIAIATGGVVAPPGGGGLLKDAGRHYIDGLTAANRANQHG